jgi:hypothetical protein
VIEFHLYTWAFGNTPDEKVREGGRERGREGRR